ncbi:AAA family ATPase [Alteromonas sp. 14N.309.X.WAT.G.H12]|uniref:AAA family ATPase n=1 Tax=Alteromonas sp. 14N.309.X.WAT.G.H12 TaxID=3120824 RepID=UPI002FD38164
MINATNNKIKLNVYEKIMAIGESSNLSVSVMEEFRSIKREILHTAFHCLTPDEEDDLIIEPKNRIMVTSISDGAGKTFVAYNLARSIANEQDKNVLLVDADVVRSTLSRTTEPKHLDGLLDYLASTKAEISQLIYHTDRENMRFMPVGQDHFLANEFFSSDKMFVLMNEFRDRYSDRLVIFDAPSLLDVNESVALTAYIDQVIIIVEEGKTRDSDIQTALKRIPDGVCVHFILNKTLHGNDWRTR